MQQFLSAPLTPQIQAAGPILHTLNNLEFDQCHSLIGFFLSFQIQKKIDEALNDVTSSLSFLKDERDYIKALPEQGMSQPEVLQKMKEYSSKGESVVQQTPHMTLPFLNEPQ